MNIYHLKIIYPGMNSFRDVIESDGFYADKGGYYFYHNCINVQRKIKYVYPVELTVIERIEYNTDES